MEAICPCFHYLNDQEQQRFYQLSPPQNDRFLKSRTCLREVLGHYLSLPPRSVPLTFTPRGKPIVIGHPCHFNLSHSGNWLVIAVNKFTPVGIDLEQMQERSFTHLIDRYFSLPEQEWFHQLGINRSPLVLFYRAWVIKEAYSKLLDIPLRQVLRSVNTIPLLDGKTNIIAGETIVVITEGNIGGFRYALAHRSL